MATLSDNVLLDIFDFYRNAHDHFHCTVWRWDILVHVCRRWRQLIFESPLRLNLQIFCTYGTPVKKHLSIWPILPIAIDYCFLWVDLRPGDDENVTTALEHPDRVGHLGLALTDGRLEKLATAIDKPFPVLRRLIICSMGRNTPLLPTEFMGGSAPRLQIIRLSNISFPTLPTLLLSSSDLVELKLNGIDYISPEAMVACLARLPRLKQFHIRFQSTTPRPDRIPLLSIARAVLPALADFQYNGVSEYLEDFTARIDCPQLDNVNLIYTDYFSQPVDLHVSQLSRFFNLSVGPDSEIYPFRHAKTYFDFNGVTFNLYRPTTFAACNWHPATTVIVCRGVGSDAFQMAQVLSTFSAILSTVVDLKLVANFDPESTYPLGEADDFEWLHLLRQVSTVQALYISQQIAVPIARALKSITGEMAAEASSSLDLICLEDQPTSSVEKFIAVRRLSDRPVTVVSTEAEFDQILRSYSRK